ncbi:MAG: CRISPR-associated protein Csx15 [Anaerolineae bacterium]|nr:CRISPR-associated protein Csx15 [Anaerolineae bacterium]
MKVLNFGHPFTEAHMEQLRHMLGEEIEVYTIPVNINLEQPIAGQISDLLTGLPFDLQTEPFVVNLPGLSIAAVALIAELHGRAGHFPAVLRMKQVKDSAATTFAIAELVQLQEVRNTARLRR